MAVTDMQTKPKERSSWSGTAFMVEALVLLAVLVACMAVFTQLFAHALTMAHTSEQLSNAVAVAQNAAEEFSTDPVAVSTGQTVGEGVAAHGVDGYDVACDVTSTPQGNGTMYAAHITVSSEGTQLYELDASRYVSEVR